jgi:hypothetical protein
MELETLRKGIKTMQNVAAPSPSTEKAASSAPIHPAAARGNAGCAGIRWYGVATDDTLGGDLYCVMARHSVGSFRHATTSDVVVTTRHESSPSTTTNVHLLNNKSLLP